MSRKAGVIGDPIKHSLSPRIFSLAKRYLAGVPAYKAHRVRRAELAGEVRALKAAGYAGLNVTIPHKTAIIAELSSLSRAARLIGAVNVVRFHKRGLRGHNTDAAGFSDSLREAGFSPRGRDAVIFGAGGAARAVGFVLGSLGCRRVRITARKPAKGRALARALNQEFPRARFSAGKSRPADLWVNATPLGMKGFPDRSPAPGAAQCALAFDLVYGRRTPFLDKAEKQGARTVDGLSMLVYQALRSWEFWFRPLGARRRRALKNDIMERLL